jgi:hypothetical protein
MEARWKPDGKKMEGKSIRSAKAKTQKNVGVKIFLANLRFFVHASHGKKDDLFFLTLLLHLVSFFISSGFGFLFLLCF